MEISVAFCSSSRIDEEQEQQQQGRGIHVPFPLVKCNLTTSAFICSHDLLDLTRLKKVEAIALVSNTLVWGMSVLTFGSHYFTVVGVKKYIYKIS